MTRFAVFVVSLLIPLLAGAQSPSLSRYVIRRDSRGKLLSISLNKPLKMSSAGPTLLDDLRDEYDREQAQAMAFGDSEEAPVPETDEQKKMWADSRQAVARKIKRRNLDDPALKREDAKANEKLDRIDFFQLIAAPYNPAALDQGKETKRTIDAIALAGSVALVSDLFSVFQFLVYQHVEALESRRAFYQNQLLTILDSPEGRAFSEEEKKLIRSSIFYSRIDIMKTKTRRQARAAWPSFGTRAYEEIQKNCSKTNPRPVPELGACFKNAEHEIKNSAVIKHGKPATAFDYDKPYSVRNHRRFLMLTKLGAQFVPVPGLVKRAFCKWIDGKYVPQRRAEGYLHGSLLLAGKNDLAQWVIVGSANPKLD